MWAETLRAPAARALARALDAHPRLGWVTEPSPVTVHGALRDRLGASWLGIKRDDQIEALFGGAKPRKLDYLLAVPPYTAAPAFAAVGASSSGQLVAVAAAAERLGRALDVTCFGVPSSPHGLENLSYVATRARSIRFFPNRAALALLSPRALIGSGTTGRGAAIVPPGATSPIAMLGMVRAGLELAAQIHSGDIETPDRIVVALGTAGTALGIAAGLGIAGLRPVIQMVSTVERPLSTSGRLRSLERALRSELTRLGAEPFQPAPWVIDRSALGRGYGQPSARSLAAVDTLGEALVPAEPVYTGKAWASLLALEGDPLLRGARILFWQSCRRGPLPVAPDWNERLPAPLRAAIERAIAHPERARPESGRPEARSRGFTRRQIVVAGAAVAAAGGALVRATGYPSFSGVVLSGWEAAVVRAAAEALLPPAPLDERLLSAIPANVDRFLLSMNESARQEVHGMMALIEHATPLGGSIARFTRLDGASRVRFFESLVSRGGLLRTAALGLRDLVLIGYYQDPASWAALGYEGPSVSREVRPSAYDAMIAAPGAVPRSAAG